MKKAVSYLSSLKFDPKLQDTWHAKYIVQIRLVIILIFTIVVMGLFGYSNLPRRLNPEIKIPIVIVNTILPGAAPQDIESLVTIPLEDKIKAVSGIDTLTSTSLENRSIISIQFLSTINADKARDDVQSAVNSVTNLPKDIKTPSVAKLDFENQPVWNFVITTDKDQASLIRFSDQLKDKIKDLPKVDKVTVSGTDTQEIEVKILPEKVKEYNINPITLSQIIQKATSSYPAGNVQTNNLSFPLSIDKDVTDIEGIRNLIITINDKPVRLGEIAAVSLKSAPHQLVSFFASKKELKPSVQFFVFKTPNSNIDAAEKEIRSLVEKTISEYNGEFKLTSILDNADEIVTQFSELTREFSTTILLVFILLLLFLGLRQAVISSITVPLTFLASFAVIHALGLSLNFLTTFSFLIALGVLIDDAIVVVAAMTRYYATGKFTPAQAGILVWRDFVVPLVSTAITTIWAFVPLLLSSGIIGEFIKTIPIVVTVAMISSTLIALLITLPLMIVFLKPQFPHRVQILLRILGLITPLIMLLYFIPKNAITPIIVLLFVTFSYTVYRIRIRLGKITLNLLNSNKYLKNIPTLAQRISDKGLIDIEVLSRAYMRVIDRILRSKHGKRNTLIAIIAFTIFAYLLVPFGLVKNEFFPKQNANLIYINTELPSGTNIEITNQETKNILEQVKDLPNINFAVAESGASFNGNQGRSSNGNGILVTLHLIDKKQRRQTSSDIAHNLREKFKSYTKGTLTVQEQSGGPPAGADLQVTLLGDDLTTLDKYADTVITFFKSQQGVTNANKSIKPGPSKIVFTPDKDKLSENGLSADFLSLVFRTYASGFTLDTIKSENTDTDINLRISDKLQTPEDLGKLTVNTVKGPIPLLSLGKLSLYSNPTIITREKGKRSINVSATVVNGFNVTEKNKQLEDFVRTKLNLAPGYSWKTGGINEENQKSVQSILQAMILSTLLILVTMVIEFRSFRQTFIALMFIPLSISGVFYIFALTNTPLSFPALIGVLALFGIVVRHAIVVIEKINDNLKEGMDLHESIVDAAGNRLEPVLLTSLAAILGLIPITLSDPLWRGLGGAIIAGLLFSGAIKLFFVPVTYYLLFSSDKKA